MCSAAIAGMFAKNPVTIGATIIIKIRQQSELRPKTNMNYNTCVETARMFQNMCYKNEYLIVMMS